jgi:hypothetical protein
MPNDNTSRHPLSRRLVLLQGASLLGVLGAAACQKGPQSCTDVSKLTSDQKTTRTTLGYEDFSREAGKTCVKCSQYTEPPSADQCGGCKVLPGPVHPNGYCRVFTPKA